jgi:SAM-dependent methyltransferase
MTSKVGTELGLPPLSIRAWLRYDLINQVLNRLQPRRILEIGCGQGALGARLADRGDYTGVEPDGASFEVARGRIEPRGGTVVHGTDQAVGDDAEGFDLVCAFEVLEHIEDDEAALKTWAEHVKPGGHLLLSVPAWQDRFGPMDANVGHFRRYSPEDLTDKLVAAGFVAPDVTVYGWPLGFALEAVRNRVDSRKLAGAHQSGASAAELTAASGRTFQPPNPIVGRAIQVATVPFRLLQRRRPTAGIGLISVARRPT